jgi:hypothetical protein
MLIISKLDVFGFLEIASSYARGDDVMENTKHLNYFILLLLNTILTPDIAYRT